MQQPLRRVYLLYHELRPGGSDYSYVVSTADFQRHLDTFVQLRQQGNTGLWPEITFDDGHISNFEYAMPALQSRGLKARFFITAGWTGQRPGYMGWDELRALHKSGQGIGAHGWSHTLLTHCNQKELQTELAGARKTLEDRLGAAITTMSLPGGRYNRSVLDACTAAGYTQVYTSVPRSEPDPAGTTVGRLNIRGDMTLEWITNLLAPGSKVLAGLERQYQIKATAKTLLGDRLYEKLWALLNRKEADATVGDAAAE